MNKLAPKRSPRFQEGLTLSIALSCYSSRNSILGAYTWKVTAGEQSSVTRTQAASSRPRGPSAGGGGICSSLRLYGTYSLFLILEEFPTTLRNFLLMPEEFPPHCESCLPRQKPGMGQSGTHQTYPQHPVDVWTGSTSVGPVATETPGTGGSVRVSTGCTVPQCICTQQCPMLFLPTLTPKPDASACLQLHPT